MKKTVIVLLIAVIFGLIFLYINTIFQNEDSGESTVNEGENTKIDAQPQGRNFSAQLDEKMGFSAP